MTIDSDQVLQPDGQSVTELSPDAYEAYLSPTQDDGMSPSCDMLQPCRPGEAYTELWQHLDAQ